MCFLLMQWVPRAEAKETGERARRLGVQRMLPGKQFLYFISSSHGVSHFLFILFSCWKSQKRKGRSTAGSMKLRWTFVQSISTAIHITSVLRPLFGIAIRWQLLAMATSIRWMLAMTMMTLWNRKSNYFLAFIRSWIQLPYFPPLSVV